MSQIALSHELDPFTLVAFVGLFELQAILLPKEELEFLIRPPDFV